jgi:hypothetical protein
LKQGLLFRAGLTGLLKRFRLDYEDFQEEEADRQAEAELIAAGGFGQSRERGVRSLWDRIDRDIQNKREQYRFCGSDSWPR